jgi:hypothetical protein
MTPNVAGPKAFTRAFFGACLIALVWTGVLLGFTVATTNVASVITAMLVSIITAITALIGIFQPPKFPTIDPKITRGVVTVVLIADFGVSAGWAGWSYYQAHQPIDVRSMVTLAHNVDVMPGGHVTLDAAITNQRRTISLVFQVVDHNESIGNCVPSTSLSVTPDMGGNRGDTFQASSRVPILVDLPAGITKLHLDIAVSNTRSDSNCSVDLSVMSAILRD